MAGALKKYAVYEIVQDIVPGHFSGMVVKSVGQLRLVDEFDDEGTAEFAARKHAITLSETEDPLTRRTVTVLPVWRVT